MLYLDSYTTSSCVTSSEGAFSTISQLLNNYYTASLYYRLNIIFKLFHSFRNSYHKYLNLMFPTLPATAWNRTHDLCIHKSRRCPCCHHSLYRKAKKTHRFVLHRKRFTQYFIMIVKDAIAALTPLHQAVKGCETSNAMFTSNKLSRCATSCCFTAYCCMLAV